MRAARITELGRPPEPGEVDAPEPTEGKALVEISAVALNPIDLAIGAGRFYGGHPTIRYWMLETIRQFGPERLEAAGCYLDTRAFVDF